MRHLVKSIPHNVLRTTLLLLLAANVSLSQNLAFPEAEGFGKFASGGRGGTVLKVTNLNDSGRGSFREACEANGPRTVIFTTGGIINLRSPVEIKNNDITIAGQTAPGDGICIAGNQITVKAKNVIIRGLRIRVGSAVFRHALQVIRPASNVIIDHCSFSWARDAMIATWDSVSSITIQNCILSEPLSSVGASAHAVALGPGPSQNGDGSRYLSNATFYHNVIAHSTGRNPKVHFEAEVINNLVYNWDNLACYASMYAQLDFIGNHYVPGPNTGNVNSVSLQSPKPSLRIFVDDNITPERPNNNGNNWNVVSASMNYRSYSRLNSSGLVPNPVETVFDYLISNTGALYPQRDEVDSRIVDEILAGNGRVINFESEVGGYPTYDAGTPPRDNDGDGMPDSWEVGAGTNPNSPDASGDRDGNGYTNIEDFINGVYNDFTTSESGLGDGIPDAFVVHQNYPNPFNPSTTLRYDLPEDARVSVSIYNILGQPVAHPFDGDKRAGSHELEWVAISAEGQSMPSGPYFYRVQATSVTGKSYDRTMKLLLLK